MIEPMLMKLPCKVNDPIPLGEGAVVGRTRDTDTMDMPEGSTLYDLVQLGITNIHACVGVVVCLREELSLVKDIRSFCNQPNLLIITTSRHTRAPTKHTLLSTLALLCIPVVDDVQDDTLEQILYPGAPQQPVDSSSATPLDENINSEGNALPETDVPSFQNNCQSSQMVGAFSHSTAVGKLRKDLPDVPSNAHVMFPRYTLDEAAAVSHYYLRFLQFYQKLLVSGHIKKEKKRKQWVEQDRWVESRQGKD
ncbi:28S ribosomal protein S29-related protein [Artemisia annua]|uniref:Small ribosomal subunit protein mS29 n=1 Tax=Artemisia annua TaxID=35608 RepID=A0A2U1MHI0_ARTAN|nr:28S ribosomal protein S29-related protein [Artemisia annua]